MTCKQPMFFDVEFNAENSYLVISQFWQNQPTYLSTNHHSTVYYVTIILFTLDSLSISPVWFSSNLNNCTELI